MKPTVRPLDYDELDEASRLVWLTFYYRESKDYGMEGIETFRNFIDPISLKLNMFSGGLRVFGAFIDQELVGVCALKDSRHISLLFAQNDRLGIGIGSAMLEYMLDIAKTDRVTVNSSDFAVRFYKKHGFVPDGERTTENGIIFSPMYIEK